MALTNKLTAIADAIRSKTGDTNTMTLDEMATAIQNITIGSGSSGEVSMSFDSATGILTINEV